MYKRQTDKRRSFSLVKYVFRRSIFQCLYFCIGYHAVHLCLHCDSVAGYCGCLLYTSDIANFKLRKKMPIGVMVTLRRERMYEFLEKLVRVALPRIRDFKSMAERTGPDY